MLQPAYLGQPTQLRPAAPIQLASGQFCHPLVFDPGAGTAPAPNWNCPVESWVRVPQGQPTGVPPNTSAQGWEAGFIPEAWGTRPLIRQPGANQLDQSTIPSEYRPWVTSTPDEWVQCDQSEIQTWIPIGSADSISSHKWLTPTHGA